MPVPALFNAPPTWTHQPLVLYHGTLKHYAKSIIAGINPALGNPYTDFGSGFYTTTSVIQAKSWAWLLAQTPVSKGMPAAQGTVLAFTLDRDQAAACESLAFVRGDYDAEDFWSLVFHCRQGRAGHGRPPANSFYDIVYGPVAAFWTQRVSMQNADQISFHSPAAAALLSYDPTRSFDI